MPSNSSTEDLGIPESIWLPCSDRGHRLRWPSAACHEAHVGYPVPRYMTVKQVCEAA